MALNRFLMNPSSVTQIPSCLELKSDVVVCWGDTAGGAAGCGTEGAGDVEWVGGKGADGADGADGVTGWEEEAFG